MSVSDTVSRLKGLAYATEDDVREEFVTPLLRLLGYDFARGEIVRAKALPTPYYSGTKRKEYIVPDYIVRCGARPIFVLDAKAPGEDPAEQRYIAQVHSYASHRGVGVEYFVVTNARRTLVYETCSQEFRPVLQCSLADLDSSIPDLTKTLGSAVWHRLVRLKETFTSVQAFFMVNPEAKDLILDDIVSTVSERLAAASSSQPPPKKEKLYLDTSVVLTLAFRRAQTVADFRDRVASAEVVVSSYVLKEVNQSVVKEATVLFGIVNAHHTLAEALEAMAVGGWSPRSTRLQTMLLSYCMNQGVSREEVLHVLKMILSDGAKALLPGNAQVVDVLGCPLASAEPEVQGADFTLYSRCTRSLQQCNIEDFVSSHATELGRLRTGCSVRSARSRVLPLIDRVGECPGDAKGIRNCSLLGDALIALQQPRDSVLMTLDRDQVVLAQCLGNESELVSLAKASP